MKVVLIYNSKSGGQFGLRQLRALLKSYDVGISYSFNTKQLSSQKLASLIKRGVVVAVVGGDGTINSVARLVRGTKSTLLPLPGGTFNHFVRDAGLPPTVEEALSMLPRMRERLVDVGFVNDELFLNNSNLGLYPFSLIERKNTKKLIGKWAAALLSAIDQLSIFRRHRLIIDGKKVRSPFVFIGNNVYDIKSSLIPQRTSLSRGTLTVMIATSNSRLSLMKAVLAVIRGDVSRRDDFSFEKRKDIEIYSPHSSIPVSFDGEVRRLTPPLVYSIEAKSLRILTPKAK